MGIILCLEIQLDNVIEFKDGCHLLLILFSDSYCGSLPLLWQIFQCLEAAAVTVEGNLLPCSAWKMSGAKAVATAELIKETKLVKSQYPSSISQNRTVNPVIVVFTDFI